MQELLQVAAEAQWLLDAHSVGQYARLDMDGYVRFDSTRVGDARQHFIVELWLDPHNVRVFQQTIVALGDATRTYATVEDALPVLKQHFTQPLPPG